MASSVFKRAAPVLVLLTLSAPVSTHVAPQDAATAATPRPASPPRPRFDQVPLSFERNQGQTSAEVKYFARGPGYNLFLTPTQAVVRLQAGRGDAVQASSVLKMALVGASNDPEIEGLDRRAATTHYYVGNDPERWRRDVASYAKVRYRGVYPGIDVVYYGNQRQLEYDFVVAPGADPDRIAIRFDGHERARIDGKGDLVLSTPHGDLRQHKPIAYQEVSGRRRPVAARYELSSDRRLRFALGEYDRTHALVIDPILTYSTYLGGSGNEVGQGVARIAVDSSGNSYVFGTTTSPDFPTQSPAQPALRDNQDLFVAKLNSRGNALVYSTYLGGTKQEPNCGGGIAVDANGNAYVTGCTLSPDFPVRGGMQGDLQGLEDAVIAKFDTRGALVYSTYLGLGGDATIGNEIAVNARGEAHVAGRAFDGTRAFPGSFQPRPKGDVDVFVVKLNAAGNALLYGTYLGGSGSDNPFGIALDASGNAYIAGGTDSRDFPTLNAFDATPGEDWNAFVAKLNTTASALLYSTYLGGDGYDLGLGLAVDDLGNAYVVGGSSGGFPMVRAIQPLHQNSEHRDAYISKLGPTGKTLVYSTYLGGLEQDEAYRVAVDTAGRAYVVGVTQSRNFPTASPWQGKNASSTKFRTQAFIARVNAAGTDLDWGSYLGGQGSETYAYGVAIDRAGTVHVSGVTEDRLPVRNAFQPSYGGGAKDNFIARISGPLQTTPHYRHNDFNDDGRADALWHHAAGRNALWMSANATIQRPVATLNADWDVAATGDFNGDHRADLFLRNRSTGQNVLWLSGLSSNARAAATVDDLSWQVAGAGDFDGDGASDVLWRNSTTGANAIWKSADYSDQQGVSGVTGQSWKIAGVADFNGDGKADILWRNTSSGRNTIWKSGNSSTQQTVAAVANRSWKIAGTGDFDGNGAADVLWRDTSTGNNVIWKDGDANAQQRVTAVTNLSWMVASVADFDGNGKSDILWRDGGTGLNVIWKAANSATQQTVTGVTDQAWTVVP